MAKATTVRKVAQGQRPAKAAASKSSTKDSAGKKKSSSARKKSRIALSIGEKQRLLKPLTGFPDLIARLAQTWKDHGGKVKVPGVTPARLVSLLRAAARASQREDALRASYETKLQPLADSRLRAEHEAWKSALDVYAMIKTAARTDPAILSPFEFFAEALAKRRGGGSAAAPPPDNAGPAAGPRPEEA